MYNVQNVYQFNSRCSWKALFCYHHLNNCSNREITLVIVMSDCHGAKDITLECKENIITNKTGFIVGSTFNNILLALFRLRCNSKYRRDLWCFSSWKAIEESLSVMLLTIATVDNVLHRMFHVILCACFDPSPHTAVLAEGALSFVIQWATYYWRFITPEDLSHVKHLLEDFLCQYADFNIASDTSDYSRQLREIIELCSIRLAINVSVATPVVHAAAFGTWDKSSEKTNVLDGTLESIQSNRAIRKPTDTILPVIAIFGVTQDMLDDSEDDNDDDHHHHNQYQCIANPSTATPHPAAARVKVGFDLLQDHNAVNIWEFDVKELARQWTLMDHGLFVAIPLTNLHKCQWTEARHMSKANEIRRFIDRFNAESCWVTQSLLGQDSPKKRAALYMKFVFLATFLDELNNFNGVMAILTALQQSCITRLTDTLSYVDDKTKSAQKRLQILMSGSMNYMKYREHLMSLLDKETNRTGIVPHLGAHLAEICSIEEGNTLYMQGEAHLINVGKLQLLSRCYLQISKMQSQVYHFCGIHLVQVCLLSEFRSGQHISSSQAALWSKDMFEKSGCLEGPHSCRIEALDTEMSHHIKELEAISNQDSRIGVMQGVVFPVKSLSEKAKNFVSTSKCSTGDDERSSIL